MTEHACTSRRGVYQAVVAANEPLCQDHYRITFHLAQFPPTRAGQFIQLQCRGLGDQVSFAVSDWSPADWPRLTQPELADKEPLLRRPLSLAARRDLPGGIVELEVIYRAKGAGTRWLAGAGTGTTVSLLGPLGNAFTVRHEKPLAALIGGGVGIPPMIYMAQALRQAGRKVVAFCGARTGAMLPLSLRAECPPSQVAHPTRCVEEFAAAGAEAVLATDDGSLGFGGQVGEAFRQWLNAHNPAAEELVVYSCGPEPMMRAAADICLSRDIECQLALERHMACGMGTCQSCVVKIRDATQRGWSFKLCCTDGPVFDAGQLLW